MPEAELPYLINSNRFEEFLKRASQTDKLVMGGWYIDNNLIYNSIFSIKSGDLYKKNHLVPFGEYIPFISGLRGIIGFFDLPMSNVSQGGSDQPNIIINETISLATPICFDIAFPNTVRKMNKSSLLMINISNDTWFGNSIGPYQHLSITLNSHCQKPLIVGMGYDYQIVDDVFGESHDIKYHIVIFLSYALTISSQNASASAKPKLIPCPARG